MPLVKLKINRWLSQGLNSNSTGFEEIPISVPEGETVLEMVYRLAATHEVFRREILDEEGQYINTNVVVILNGRIVNPYDRSETTFKEGDEVTFLPMLQGG